MRWVVVGTVALLFLFAIVGQAASGILTVTRPSEFATTMWLVGFLLLIAFGWVVVRWKPSLDRTFTAWLLFAALVGSVVCTPNR